MLLLLFFILGEEIEFYRINNLLIWMIAEILINYRVYYSALLEEITVKP